MHNELNTARACVHCVQCSACSACVQCMRAVRAMRAGSASVCAWVCMCMCEFASKHAWIRVCRRKLQITQVIQSSQLDILNEATYWLITWVTLQSYSQREVDHLAKVAHHC